MPLPVPNLDDRDYTRLLADAKAIIGARAPQWSDLSPSDPGIILVEAMAHLTESMIFRLNQVPDKALVCFLNLIGVAMTPPASAAVELIFSAKTGAEVVIPRGTRVSTTSGKGPVFAIVDDAVLAPAANAGTATSVAVVALQCEEHRAELLGVGNGRPGQGFTVAHAPIVLATGHPGDLYLGVEASPEELSERTPAIRSGSVTYRLWREVDHFGSEDATGPVFVVDRLQGIVSFSPFSHPRPTDVPRNSGRTDATGPAAEVPRAGAQVRAWYRSGGGATGNVRPHLLTALKDPIAGVSVTNPGPAAGGRDAEDLSAALLRGRNQVNTFDRVITAGDYERVAVASSGGVSRAMAVPTAKLWAGGTPGEVRILIVPSVDPASPCPADSLFEHQLATTLDWVRRAMIQRAPLGVTSLVKWAGLKRFHVEADAVVHRAEDATAVQARLSDRLSRTLSPVPAGGRPGWAFGEALRTSTVYDVLLAERGVRFVENVRLVVDEVPGDVTALITDPSNDETWFCASDKRIFRSTDDAAGWELLATCAGETVERLSTCIGRTGVVLAASRVVGTETSRVRVSRDYGETWELVAEFAFHVEDITAGRQGEAEVAFLATDAGMFRLNLTDGAIPETITVEAAQPTLGIYAVQVVSAVGAELQIAAAAQELGGVFVSFQGGRSGTYQQLGLTGVDVRRLVLHQIPGRRFLFSGAFATGDDPGSGIAQIELLPYQVSADGWRRVGSEWVGGSCRDLTIVGVQIFAATARSGVATTELAGERPWRAATVDSGLPLREVGRFQPLVAVQASQNRLLAGCVGGVFATRRGDATARTPSALTTLAWTLASSAVFTERIALPSTWLFAPGEHQLSVRYDDAS